MSAQKVLHLHASLTPLERLIEDAHVALTLTLLRDHAEYEARAKEEIKAVVEFHRRGIGQQVRFARARIQRHFAPPTPSTVADVTALHTERDDVPFVSALHYLGAA